jgi:predicted PurR-regulated permease PerM
MNEDSVSIKNFFFYFVATVVIIAGIKIAKSMVILLLLSILFATLFLSFLNFFRSYKVPDIISYTIIIITFMLMNTLLFFTITSSLYDFIQDLPTYKAKIESMLIFDTTLFGYQFELKKLMQNIDLSGYIKYITGAFSNIGNILSKLVLIMIGIVFILQESSSFSRKLNLIFKNRQDKLESLKLFSINIQKYFVAKTFTSLLTGILISIMLLFFGIEYPILWGVVAFLLNFIPFIGSLVASIPAIFLSLISADIDTTLMIIFFYLIINITISNILEPKVFGYELGLSPMIIFFSLIFFGWLLGIMGMFIAVPIVMTLKIAFNINEHTKWIGILLSNISKK